MEVVPEAQSVGAEQGKVSLQELRVKPKKDKGLNGLNKHGGVKPSRDAKHTINNDGERPIRTMNANEVKRKLVTSFTYGPCPITSLMPWKKDTDPGLLCSGRRQDAKTQPGCKKTNTA